MKATGNVAVVLSVLFAATSLEARAATGDALSSLIEALEAELNRLDPEIESKLQLLSGARLRHTFGLPTGEVLAAQEVPLEALSRSGIYVDDDGFETFVEVDCVRPRRCVSISDGSFEEVWTVFSTEATPDLKPLQVLLQRVLDAAAPPEPEAAPTYPVDPMMGERTWADPGELAPLAKLVQRVEHEMNRLEREHHRSILYLFADGRLRHERISLTREGRPAKQSDRFFKIVQLADLDASTLQIERPFEHGSEWSKLIVHCADRRRCVDDQLEVYDIFSGLGYLTAPELLEAFRELQSRVSAKIRPRKLAQEHPAPATRERGRTDLRSLQNEARRQALLRQARPYDKKANGHYLVATAWWVASAGLIGGGAAFYSTKDKRWLGTVCLIGAAGALVQGYFPFKRGRTNRRIADQYREEAAGLSSARASDGPQWVLTPTVGPDGSWGLALAATF